MKLYVLGLILLLNATLLTAYAGINSTWDGYNDPFKINPAFISTLSDLPLEADIKDTGLGWPGSYWPSRKAGIARRWNSTSPNFEYESPSFSQLRTMSSKSINELSPAEKFDIFARRYDYPTVQRVWDETSKRDPLWHGICHGVSSSGRVHQEPQTVTLTNPDGVTVTFYSSDVKALLAYYYAKVSDSKVIQVAKRCFGFSFSGACSDINAGSFHIILTNMLGIQKESVIADLVRTKQVWNHAALTYEGRILGYSSPSIKSAEGTVRQAEVKMVVEFAASIEPQHDPVIGTKDAKYEVKHYHYKLDLDRRGRIIGGEWISKERPDFMWVKEKDTFSGFWAPINEIYKPVVFN